MAKNEIFVERQEELKEFASVLDDPHGQTIIVVGNREIVSNISVDNEIYECNNR